jgi:ataxia telangiectasia mutated family protein
VRVLLSIGRFSLAEQLTATRLSIISSAVEREDKDLLGDLTTPQSEVLTMLRKACHLRLSALARKDGNLQAAVNAITAVQFLERGDRPSDHAQDEFSQVLWMQQEHALAIQHVQEMIEPMRAKPEVYLARLPVLLARLVR